MTFLSQIRRLQTYSPPLNKAAFQFLFRRSVDVTESVLFNRSVEAGGFCCFKKLAALSGDKHLILLRLMNENNCCILFYNELSQFNIYTCFPYRLVFANDGVVVGVAI